MAEPGTEKAYVKYAWAIFFVFGLLTTISSTIGLLGNPPNPPSPESTTGLTSNQIAARIPGISDYIGSIARQLGNFMLAMGVLIMGVAAVPFRRGEKWARYIFWILPVLLVIQLTNSFPFYSRWWVRVAIRFCFHLRYTGRVLPALPKVLSEEIAALSKSGI
ncbi:MAG TPA: hypothetical protein VGR56_10550 [Nitrososphaerales archaeon]|nr:hypothetical protein [Nitrososphaerales archaeon]